MTEKFVVYVEFRIHAEDIDEAEKQANEIVDTWDKKPKDTEICVRATDY